MSFYSVDSDHDIEGQEIILASPEMIGEAVDFIENLNIHTIEMDRFEIVSKVAEHHPHGAWGFINDFRFGEIVWEEFGIGLDEEVEWT